MGNEKIKPLDNEIATLRANYEKLQEKLVEKPDNAGEPSTKRIKQKDVMICKIPQT